ncbi:MAG: FGGY-family carbohydrate kinase [Clostridia bacterium]|nr:FGGY-family carbohydrate kinase [Clostridia bacterium]MBR2908605.1 FGGY-family carbohydrate kinase [Clostridia bacterium]
MKYVIAYDLGTGGIKTSIFGEDGESKGFRFKSYDTRFPREGFREQSPDVWWEAVKITTKELLAETAIDPEDIVSLAVSGHSLGALPIGYNGELLCEYVPIWSDSRATAEAEDFFTKVPRNEWYLSTGNGFTPELYSIFKILWYKNNMPKVYEATDKFIGTKDYINYKMTGVLATDISYASGCGVFSLADGCYNEEYIKKSGIDGDKLPKVLNSTDIVGKILPDVAAELGLSSETLVCAGGVDNACMALGAGCIDNGEVYTSLGTSAWISVTDEKPIVDIEKKPYVFAHCVPDKYVSALGIYSAGNSLRWVRDKLFADLLAAELAGGESSYKSIDKLASSSSLGANKLFFIPTLAGGSSLDRTPDARGGFFGLDLRHTREDIARATLEGISLNLNVLLNFIKKYVMVGENMLIVGGGAKSPLWRQIFADVYAMNVYTSKSAEDAGSFGAACLAAVGAGIWNDFDTAKSVTKVDNMSKPEPSATAFYSSILPSYKKLLDISSDVGDILKSTN